MHQPTRLRRRPGPTFATTPAARATALVERLLVGDDAADVRPLIVAAHPDDETIGATALLMRIGADAVVLHVTDGAPRRRNDAQAAGFAAREEYAAARRQEWLRVAEALNVPEDQCWECGLVDKEVVDQLEELTWHVTSVLMTLQPALVLTHPYEGGHLDHDATAFAVHAAVKLVRRLGRPAPAIAEFASYHSSGGEFAAGRFLPGSPTTVYHVELDPDARVFKQRLLATYESQQRVLSVFDASVELYRAAPAYDFSQPPHDGPLLYELYGWYSGLEWRRKAAYAARALARAPGMPGADALAPVLAAVDRKAGRLH